MATAANEPGQWQMLWDSTMPELFNMFPDSLLLPNGPMTISQSGLWDLSGPVVEADGTTTERRFSDASQCSDDYSYVERQQSDSSLEHTFDPSQNPDCGETDTSPQTREAYPQHNSPSVSTRKRKGDIPDTCTSNNNQLWSSTRQAKSRRDRERNRVPSAVRRRSKAFPSSRTARESCYSRTDI